VSLETASTDLELGGAGEEMYRLAERLFPLGRSLTGDGVRATLRILQERLPALEMVEVPTGTRAFDWVVPDEWNVREAYLLAPDGTRVVDYADHNLHLVGYSVPVDEELSLEDLQAHLFSRPDLPDAVPYVTSYYAPFWGFCLAHRQRLGLVVGRYRAVVDSTLKPGFLTYGELVVPGRTPQEILISTYVCHPSMANNELSGIVVAAHLAGWALRETRRFTYRFVFVPETVGAIVYLSQHLEHMQRHTVAGFQVTCVGDERAMSFLPSRRGDTLADRCALHVLLNHATDVRHYSFFDRGSDERQWCSPGVDLPVVSIMRSKYGTYPEYHTSLDDMSLISPAGLDGSAQLYLRCLQLLEANHRYRATMPCEPQLSKRGLYPSLSFHGGEGKRDHLLLDFLTYCDGERDLIGVADHIGVDAERLVPIAEGLLEQGLISPVDRESGEGL
jgi:aminopeptidase-like protein